MKKKKKDRLKMMLPELTTSEKLNLSVMTADTEAAVPGPGAYSVTYTGVEIVKNVGLSKASRFEASKRDESHVLNVKYTQVEPQIKGVRIRPSTAIDEKLERKKILEAEQEEARARAELKALKEKELREKYKIEKEVKKERVKTEKERLIELFRLVKVSYRA